MTRDHIDINDFTILVEEYDSDTPVVDSCAFEEPSIGVLLFFAPFFLLVIFALLIAVVKILKSTLNGGVILVDAWKRA